MKTVILCGGMGTRIRDISENKIPKPMIPIGQYPILWHIMNLYAYQGHNEFILCLGHLGWQIKEFFLNFKSMSNDFKINLSEPKTIEYYNTDNSFDWEIIFAETGEYAQTGARVRKIWKYVKEDKYFMLTYGDGLSNVDINKLINFHKTHNKIATVTGVRPSGRFGEIETSDDYQVIEFNEKPQTSGGWINGGFFVINTNRLWDYLPDRENLNFEQETLKKLATDGELMMFRHHGFWQPMDTYREYKLLNNLWDSSLDGKSVPWVNKNKIRSR
jgi:glucose-1-phosphate cytidylyltransferase